MLADGTVAHVHDHRRKLVKVFYESGKEGKLQSKIFRDDDTKTVAKCSHEDCQIDSYSDVANAFEWINISDCLTLVSDNDMMWVTDVMEAGDKLFEKKKSNLHVSMWSKLPAEDRLEKNTGSALSALYVVWVKQTRCKLFDTNLPQRKTIQSCAKFSVTTTFFTVHEAEVIAFNFLLLEIAVCNHLHGKQYAAKDFQDCLGLVKTIFVTITRLNWDQ